ncbi:hypothetical protein CLU81_4960 [Flavobacterium sp. 9]|nr:hypothetical protein CLU81_4960 [Flavobacterium sp. 9]
MLKQKDVIEENLLKQISAVLKIPVEAFQNFDEEQAVNVISNSFGDNGIGYQRNDNPTFNTIDKIVELYDEKIALYERMLKEKDEMMARFEKLIKDK